jgi:hypothetical protein
MRTLFDKKLNYTMAGLWKWKSFLALLSCSLFFGLIYFTPYFQGTLIKIDNIMFTKIFKLFKHSHYLQTIFVLASHGYSYIIFFSLAILLWLSSIKNTPSHLVLHKIAEFIFSILMVFVTVYGLNYLLFHSYLHFSRPNPQQPHLFSQVLIQVYDWIHHNNPKSYFTPNLFSTIVLGFLTSSLICLNFQRKCIAILISLYFLFPSLLFGHLGITDLLLGSSSLILWMTAMSFYTPAYYFLTHLITNWILFIKNQF